MLMDKKRDVETLLRAGWVFTAYPGLDHQGQVEKSKDHDPSQRGRFLDAERGKA